MIDCPSPLLYCSSYAFGHNMDRKLFLHKHSSLSLQITFDAQEDIKPFLNMYATAERCFLDVLKDVILGTSLSVKIILTHLHEK